MSMDDLSLAKKEARKRAFAARKEAKTPQADAAAASSLIDVLEGFSDRIIAGYMPIRSEVNPLPAMSALARKNRLCVPVIQGDGLPLLFREWTPEADMIDGPFGALVPASGAFIEPEILIVPMVAYDPRGFRLGYGGGFYDRTLERLRDLNPSVLAIGFAFGAQCLDDVPQEPTDQPLDMIVTEAEVLRLSQDMS
ncbi:5-formyltetrahydrofolate cyclo-ligase [Rhodovulum sp. FJ3]|jgi:5-formyltetrahydrofolate cyclo-ligase|uniref:5-formyltetrahydrofolate cyclo-ligase n=1 Tax=Rhodovulum sp. FJ3 TaxID=3079053 RepID=UPI00293DED57|nr:5-formyltetrahydrofolate cyclo-ligase [Rhodovulum sp. FJ3]MDV4168841.1 5-formyltetrahydrofolate cyclo-ligase [Rhodovulum sp. FJ3]